MIRVFFEIGYLLVFLFFLVFLALFLLFFLVFLVFVLLVLVLFFFVEPPLGAFGFSPPCFPESVFGTETKPRKGNEALLAPGGGFKPRPGKTNGLPALELTGGLPLGGG